MAQFVDAATEAIARVRDNACDDDWVLCGFGHPKKCDDMAVIGSGTGGMEALAAVVPDGDVAYGLVRASFLFDTAGSVKAETVKFVYVHWRPEVIPLARKMKIGILEGKIKKALSPYHCDIEAEDAETLTDAAVQALLGDVSGTTDRTGDEKATFAATGQMTAGSLLNQKASSFLPTGTGADAGQGRARGAAVAFGDEAELAERLGAVKLGAAGAWALWRYADVKTLAFGAGGDRGGVAAALEACPDDSASYAVFTTEESRDVSEDQVGAITTKKFCFFVFQPEGLPPTRKAKIATHKGAVTKAIREHFPYQYDFFLSARDELSDADVKRHIGKLTGTISSVTDGAAAAKDLKLPPGDRRAVHARAAATTVGGVVKQATLDADEAAIRSALDAVRDDGSDADWAVAAFRGSTRLELVGSGAGGLGGLRAAFPRDAYAYGLVRLADAHDRSTTTKFLFVSCHAESVKPSLKGQLACLTGLVKAAFSPFHASTFVTDVAELTDDHALATVRGDRSRN